MANRKRLFTYVEVDDNTPIQNLSIKDQLRVILRDLTRDDAEELKADDAATVYELQLRANLLEFIRGSTELIRKGVHSSVTMSISSRFEPVLDEVLSSSAVSNFYDVSVRRPNIEYDIPYMIEVTLEVKRY